MRAAWFIATSNLRGRWRRHALITIATALAASLSVFTAGMLGTMHASVVASVTQVAGLGDLMVRHRYGERIPAAMRRHVGAWDQVALIAGRFGTGANISFPKQGRRLQGIALGIDPSVDHLLNPLPLSAGRKVSTAGEAVLDHDVAEQLGASVGDLIHLQSGVSMDVLGGLADRMLGHRNDRWANGPSTPETIALRVVGIRQRPALSILQRPTALMALADAERLAGMHGKLDSLHLKLRDGVNPEDFRAAKAPMLPGSVVFQSSAGLAAGANRALRAIRLSEAVLAIFVLLCSGLMILTGLTTAVEQQQRELATLRCIGAERRHVVISQLIVGSLLGVVSVIVALPLGLAASYALHAYRPGDTAVAFSPDPAGLIVAVAATLLAGLGGAAVPAWRAAAIPPVRAMASRSTAASRRGLLASAAIGATMIALQPLVLLLPVPDVAALWFYLGGGVVFTVTGYFLLSVPLTAVAACTLAPTIALALRLPRHLLRQSVAKTPYRHGFTGAAMMLGVAMLISVWTGGRAILSQWFTQVRMPDGFVHSVFPMTDAQLAFMQTTPVLTDTCATTAFPVQIVDVQFGAKGVTPPHTLFTSFDPDAFFRMADLQWVQGDPERARRRLREGGAVLVSREYLVAHGIGVGSRIGVATPDGDVQPFDVAGVIASPGLDVAVSYFGIHRYYADASISTIFGTRDDARRYFHNTAVNLVLVRFAAHQSDEAVLAQLHAGMPGTISGSARQIRLAVEDAWSALLRTASGMAVTFLLIASFGVGHILAANLDARRYEYGVLRAVGAPPLLLGRLILGETVVITTVAAVLGTLLGGQFALVDRLFLGRLYGWAYSITWPVDVILTAAGATLLFGCIAAMPSVRHLVVTSPAALLAAGKRG